MITALKARFSVAQRVLKLVSKAPVYKARGFTLIEMMVAIAIMGIILAIGVPNFIEFVADQRVRAAASDIVSDVNLARAESLKTQRRVVMARAGSTAAGTGCAPSGGTSWSNGWCIFVDNNKDGVYAATDGDVVIRSFEGYSGRLTLCTSVTDFANSLTFRPDGRVVRTSAAVETGATPDAFTVSDNLGDTTQSNNKVRNVVIGLSGRTSVINSNGSAGC
jgi:type IV fimbrial biogenesis protein FimT